MRAAPDWKEDLSSLLDGFLLRSGFIGRTFCPNASEPLVLPCLLAYSLYLHSRMTYPQIQDFFRRSWTPKVKPILDFGEDVHRLGCYPEWWERWGVVTVERIAELLGDKGNLLNKVKSGSAITLNDTSTLNSLATLLHLSIIWIEDQAEGPLTHHFTNTRDQDLALFVYLFQSGRSLSLLYHRDMDIKEGSQRFPFYMIVGEPFEPFVIGNLAGQPQYQSRAFETEETAKSMERKVTEAALAVVMDCCRENIPIQAAANVNQLKEAISNYQSISLHCQTPVLDLSFPQKALSEAPIRRKCLPRQHTLRDCRSSQVSGDLVSLTCGHDFHAVCLQVYISLQSDRLQARCPCCSRVISSEWVRTLDPNYYEDAENTKDTTLLQAYMGLSPFFSPANSSGFLCPQCGEMKIQRTAHACAVCSDCMTKGILCGTCGQPLNEQDRQIVQSTLSRR